ncbi:lipopolysaccharide biosynthesis protein [Actinomadura kijaniata]|uniref:lipopolysaccharide biosynthesis protein n=1 Tax=Actinomadura kijaniata TaxID=46161 RepID=UPI000AB3B6C2|nr:lipopolysaccharide biosynthesis protein [Actinomadura kijaniata]
MSGPNLGRMARGGALNLVGAVSAGLLGLALVFVVARSYDQATAGAFFAANALFLILAVTAGLGTDTGLLRAVPRRLALGEHAAARRTVPVALVPVVGVAVVAAGALAVTAPWLAGLLGAGDTGSTAAMLRTMAAFLPLAALQDALLAATRGHGTMRPTVLVDKLFRQFAQVVGVLAAPVFSGDPAALALAWALPYLPGALVAALWYRKVAARTWASAPPATAPVASRELAGEFWRYTGPRAIGGICQQALQRVDIVLMAALSSPRDAALYTVATRFVVVGQLGTQAVQNVMQPQLSRLLALEDREGAQRTFAIATTWTVLLTWPVHLAVATAAPVYLSLFGPSYSEAGQWTTVVLALSMLLATIAGPLDVLLLMAGRSGLSLANSAAALGTTVVLSVLLIGPLGPLGAAAARAAGILVRNLLGMVQVRRLLRIGLRGAGLPVAVAVTMLCFGVFPLVARLLAGPGPIASFAGLIPGILVYFALLWAVRGRLVLTAFTALLPGRRGPSSPAPRDDSPRRVHANEA